MNNPKKVILWTAVAAITTMAASHYLGEPLITWLDNVLKTSPGKSFNTPTADNASINTIAEGNQIIVKDYTNVPVITKVESQTFFNPFIEGEAKIGRQYAANTPAGLLTGRFAAYKGIVYAQLQNNNELAWINRDTIKPI